MPTAAPTLPDATPTPSPEALATSTVRVANAGGLGVNLRAGPGTDQPILADLPDGSTLVQLGGSTSADGRSWVKVSDRAGQVGWIAKEYLAPTS
jgi:uncharacterized protein YraI